MPARFYILVCSSSCCLRNHRRAWCAGKRDHIRAFAKISGNVAFVARGHARTALRFHAVCCAMHGVRLIARLLKGASTGRAHIRRTSLQIDRASASEHPAHLCEGRRTKEGMLPCLATHCPPTCCLPFSCSAVCLLLLPIILHYVLYTHCSCPGMQPLPHTCHSPPPFLSPTTTAIHYLTVPCHHSYTNTVTPATTGGRRGAGGDIHRCGTAT